MLRTAPTWLARFAMAVDSSAGWSTFACGAEQKPASAGFCSARRLLKPVASAKRIATSRRLIPGDEEGDVEYALLREEWEARRRG